MWTSDVTRVYWHRNGSCEKYLCVYCGDSTWPARVCDSVSKAVLASIYAHPVQFEAAAILECLGDSLGMHVATTGPVGVLCAKVLTAAFQHSGGVYAAHVISLFNARRARVFFDANPETFLSRALELVHGSAASKGRAVEGPGCAFPAFWQ